GNEVGSYAVRTENPFELPSNAFDGRARTLVANVGVEADAERLPGFESMRQHEQLGLSIGSSPNRRGGQPRIANLASVGNIPAVPRMARRPCPSLQVKETCRTDDDAILHTDSRERHCGSGVSPSKSCVDIAEGFGLALRDGAPLVEGGVACRSGCQTVDVVVVKRFETNVFA